MTKKSTQVRPPIITPVLSPEPIGELTANRMLSGRWIHHELQSAQDAKSLELNGCKLESCDFSLCQFKNMSIYDTSIKDCLYYGANLSRLNADRLTWEGGNSSGVVFSDATLRDATFENVKLSLANFRFATLKRVDFINCDLCEADFSSAKLSQVRFVTSDLSKAEFSGCEMVNVDLRSSILLGLRGILSLKGARIDESQLISLTRSIAAQLGLLLD